MFYFVRNLFGGKGQRVLTKKSTHVDQNIRCDKSVSHLSMGVFIAPRNLLDHQKSLIYAKVWNMGGRVLGNLPLKKILNYLRFKMVSFKMGLVHLPTLH